MQQKARSPLTLFPRLRLPSQIAAWAAGPGCRPRGAGFAPCVASGWPRPFSHSTRAPAVSRSVACLRRNGTETLRPSSDPPPIFQRTCGRASSSDEADVCSQGSQENGSSQAANTVTKPSSGKQAKGPDPDASSDFVKAVRTLVTLEAVLVCVQKHKSTPRRTRMSFSPLINRCLLLLLPPPPCSATSNLWFIKNADAAAVAALAEGTKPSSPAPLATDDFHLGFVCWGASLCLCLMCVDWGLSLQIFFHGQTGAAPRARSAMFGSRTARTLRPRSGARCVSAFYLWGVFVLLDAAS